MKKVTTITWTRFSQKYRISGSALLKKKFATNYDFEKITELENLESKDRIIFRLLLYIPFALTHPKFITTFLIPNIKSRFLKRSLDNKKKSNYQKFINNYNMRASISKAFKPKTIFEIGTYLGVGAVAFKLANPKSKVYTINPQINSDANNPVSESYIGYYYKEKKVKVNQIWGDSMNFDFGKLNKVDFVYIDGNHDFKYVYSDLVKSSEVANKCVLLDDYISDTAKDSKLVYGPWTQCVVRAVNLYLKRYPNVFSHAYWIKGTQLCVLIKDSNAKNYNEK